MKRLTLLLVALPLVAQMLVGTSGIAIMTAVAYYRSWSKRVEKSALK